MGLPPHFSWFFLHAHIKSVSFIPFRSRQSFLPVLFFFTELDSIYQKSGSIKTLLLLKFSLPLKKRVTIIVVMKINKVKLPKVYHFGPILHFTHHVKRNVQQPVLSFQPFLSLAALKCVPAQHCLALTILLCSPQRMLQYIVRTLNAPSATL